MKTRVTKKQINNNFLNILCVDSDLIPNLLFFNPAFAYSTRAEGWACDYYETNNVCLSSGYSPIGKNINRDLQKQFEEKAKKVIQSKFFKQETKQKRINSLLTQFIEKAINS